MWRLTTPCSGASASCSPRTARGSTPRTSARTTPTSPGPVSAASRGRGCFARRRTRWGSTSGAPHSWATAQATSSRRAPSGGAASWWRRVRGARTSRRRASSARPSCPTSPQPWTRLCGRPSGRRFRFVTAVRRRSLLLIAVALGTRGLAAQTPLRIGQSVTGRLTLADRQLADSSRYRLYTFDARLGDTVSADMLSDDLDANLIVADAAANPLARNDDGGGGCNAHLSFVVPAAGSYDLFANSSSPGELGEFTISLVQGVPAAARDTTCRGRGRVKGAIQRGQTLKGHLTDGARPVEPKGICRFRTLRQQAEARAVTAAGARQIRVGQTLPGELTAKDSVYPDTTYYQFWQFSPRPRQEVTIDLSSDEFDPVLILRGLDTTVVNNNGGPRCDARVSLTFPETGPYTILVNTTSDPPRQTGRFTLSLTEGLKDQVSDECRPPRPPRPPGPSRPPPVAGSADAQTAHTIAVGQALDGELTTADHFRPRDSTYSQSWNLAGTAGQVVTVDLESTAFDPYLFVAGPGIGASLQDDDSGGNCNARLTLTFPQTGDYVIVVNSATKRGTGPFTLSVTKGAKAKSLTRCDRTG